MGRNVLIVQHSANLDGSAFSGLMLADALHESGWCTTVAFAFEGPMIEKYLDAGHDIRIVPHRSWLRTSDPIRFIRNFGKEFQAARALVKVIDEINPDLVYVNTVVSLAGAVAARWRKIPCVWHLRELFADVGGEMKAPDALRPFIKWVISFLADQIVTNSRAVARNLLDCEPGGQVIVVPNAVGKEFFDNPYTKDKAREKFGLPLHAPVIGIPGTLRPKKGHPFFFRAAPRIIEKYPDLVVAVTGDGEDDYKKELHQLVDRTGISSTVRFLGTIQAMPAFCRACDVVCVPSEAESFGRTVVEAMASGIPVVASDVGGISEIITNEVSGLLFPYGSEKALSESISKIFEDDNLRNHLMQNATKMVSGKFHEASYKSSLLDIAEKIIINSSYAKH